MGIMGRSEVRPRPCSPTSHRTREGFLLLLAIILLSLIGSAIVSAESFVSDPTNEDTLIVPGHEDHEDEDGGCDGGHRSGAGSRMHDESDRERIYPADGHELYDESDGKFEKWDDHFAKERAKQKAKGLLRSLSSSSSVPHSRRSRFGFRDRSSSFASSFFRRHRPKHDRSLSDLLHANHKDHEAEEFASDDDDAVTSDGSEIEDDSLMEPSDATPFRSRRRHSNRRSHIRSRMHPASHHANDFRDFDDMRDYSDEDAAVHEFLSSGGGRNRGRHRNRSFFRPPAEDRTDRRNEHAITGRPRRWRLFGR